MSVRSISTGPSCSIEPPASAPLAEREPVATRFEQALERESERVSDRDGGPDDEVAPLSERACSDAATHGADAPVDGHVSEEARAEDDEPLAADDASPESDADAELAALEQLLQVVAGTPPPQAPTLPPDGGDSTVAVGGAVAAITVNAANAANASQATLLAGAGAPAGHGVKSAAAANRSVDGAPAVAAEGETAAIDAPVDATGDAATGDGAFLEGGAARSKEDSSALQDVTTATLDPALAERLARELAEARPIAATSVLAATTATTATTESGAPASVARATATLAQLPALLDDAVVRLQRHDGRWEAEIRLDPPELGVVTVRLELEGGHLRVVARCDDRAVEQQLGQLFKEWDEQFRQKGGGESTFDLARRAKQEERDTPAPRSERSLRAPRAALSAGGVGPGAGLRIDLLA